MFDQTTAAQAVERDLGAIIDMLDVLADASWGLPVCCAGWQVTDLAAHLVAAARGQAEGLRRAAVGGTEPAALTPPADRDPRSLMAALKDGRDGLLSALSELPPRALAGGVPIPAGLLPAAVALQIVPLEYGFHRYDLDWGLSNPADLSQDISATLLGMLPGMLPMLAAGSPVHSRGDMPAGPVSFRLAAQGARFLASHDWSAWSVMADDGHATVTCEILGGDSPVALFVMGRIDADHPSLTVTDSGAARAFKRYFPGP
jgi:uncharacterized protein (TIGR03083 family)